MKTWPSETTIPGWYNEEIEMTVRLHEQQLQEGGEIIHEIEVVNNPEGLNDQDQIESIMHDFSDSFGKMFTNDPQIITL